MKWLLINTGAGTGKFNMEFDLQLTEICRSDEAYLRLYRWDPYCISLGANQNYDSIDAERCAADLIDIVKRPTGGRAILHAEEITYSFVTSLNIGLSVHQIYEAVNKALLNGLQRYDGKLGGANLEGVQTNFRQFYNEPESVACFAGSAKSELKYKGMKLAGSAQRKIDNILLQHGSVLCGNYHKKIVRYLKLDPDSSEFLSEMLNKKTIDVSTILNKETDYNYLEECLTVGFEKTFKIKFEKMKEEHFSFQ